MARNEREDGETGFTVDLDFSLLRTPLYSVSFAHKVVTSSSLGLASTPFSLLPAGALLCNLYRGDEGAHGTVESHEKKERTRRERRGHTVGGFNLHWIIPSKDDAFHYVEATRESGRLFAHASVP